jgi:pre-B lymphocyte gene
MPKGKSLPQIRLLWLRFPRSKQIQPGSTLYCDVSVFAGSLSQPVLTQPPSLSASLGTTERLTCTLSSGFSVSNYRIHWHQKNPGSSPRFLLSYSSDSNKYQGPGVPDRFSGSKDVSANAGVLHISGLASEDDADYYCSVWDGSSNTYTVLHCMGK